MVGRGDPFYLKFWVKMTPFGAKSPVDIRSYSASAVAPSKKIN